MIPTEETLLTFYSLVRADKNEPLEKLKKMISGILHRLGNGSETVENLVLQQREKYGKSAKLVPCQRAQQQANEAEYWGMLEMAWADGALDLRENIWLEDGRRQFGISLKCHDKMVEEVQHKQGTEEKYIELVKMALADHQLGNI
jgi:hypothetical protein